MSQHSVLVILFGAVSASILAMPVMFGFLLVVGGALSEPSLQSIGLIVACVCAFWGVLALWGVGFGDRGTFSKLGLCAGIFATFFLGFWIVSFSDSGSPIKFPYLVICPLLVSIAVLVETRMKGVDSDSIQ